MAVQNEGFNTLGTKANVSLTTDKKVYAGTIIETSTEISAAGLDNAYNNSENNFIGENFVLQSRKFTENGYKYINFDPVKNGEHDPTIVDSFQVLYDDTAHLNHELRAKTFNEAIDYITRDNLIFTTKNTVFYIMTASNTKIILNRTDVEIPIVIKNVGDIKINREMTVFFSSVDLNSLFDLSVLSNLPSTDYCIGHIKIKDETFYAIGFYQIVAMGIAPGNNYYYDAAEGIITDSLTAAIGDFFARMEPSNFGMEIDTSTDPSNSTGYIHDVDENFLLSNLIYSIFTGKDFYRTLSTNSGTNDYANISPDEIFPMFKNFRPDIDMDNDNNFILKNWYELSYILYYYHIPDDALQIGIIRKGKNRSGKKRNYNGNTSIRKAKESRGLACKFSETFSAFGTKGSSTWKAFSIHQDDSRLDKNGMPMAIIVNSGEFIKNHCRNKSWVIPNAGGNFLRYRNHYFFHLIFKINMSKISPEYVRKNGKTADPRCFRSWYSIDQEYRQSTGTCSYSVRYTAPRFIPSSYGNAEERYYGKVFN